MKKILTDIDGVVLEWETRFHEWMATLGHEPVDGYEEIYGIHNIYALPNTLDLVQRFNESAAIGYLDVFRDAGEFISRLIHEGYEFIGITAMGTEHYSQRARIQNVNTLFPGMFNKIHFVELTASKRQILRVMARAYPDAIWIEDNVPNFKTGVDLGLRSFLMDHGYNRDEDAERYGGTRVNNWAEIYNILVE